MEFFNRKKIAMNDSKIVKNVKDGGIFVILFSIPLSFSVFIDGSVIDSHQNSIFFIDIVKIL